MDVEEEINEEMKPPHQEKLTTQSLRPLVYPLEEEKKGRDSLPFLNQIYRVA